MNLRLIVLFIVCSQFTACDRRSENSTVSSSDATTQAWKDYDERVKQQQDTYAQQAKTANEQLQAQAEMQKRAEADFQAQEDMRNRAEALMNRQEESIKRQQDDAARFEKILDTWENQQKQYQK